MDTTNSILPKHNLIYNSYLTILELLHDHGYNINTKELTKKEIENHVKHLTVSDIVIKGTISPNKNMVVRFADPESQFKSEHFKMYKDNMYREIKQLNDFKNIYTLVLVVNLSHSSRAILTTNI